MLGADLVDRLEMNVVISYDVEPIRGGISGGEVPALGRQCHTHVFSITLLQEPLLVHTMDS